MDERILDISPKHQTKARRRYINTHTEKKGTERVHMSNINTCASAHTHTWVLPVCCRWTMFHFKVTYLLYMYQVSGGEAA